MSDDNGSTVEHKPKKMRVEYVFSMLKYTLYVRGKPKAVNTLTGPLTKSIALLFANT